MMAAGTLPKPGSEYGPCVDENCGHRDCDSTRKMLDAKCKYCHEAIGCERRFYILPTEQTGQVELVHASCHEDAIETENQARTILNTGAAIGENHE